MPLFVVRVWLPDRPGALGAVASRIGSVRADVVGIDILERGAGRAADELTIDIEDPQHVDLLIKEIGQVDGVDVEHVRPARAVLGDRAVEALDLAAAIASATDREELIDEVVSGTAALFGADWVAAVSMARPPAVVSSVGDDLPSAEWMAAFAFGAASGADAEPSGVSPRAATGGGVVIGELACASLGESVDHGRDGLELLLSRRDLPLREVERSLLERLSSLARTRLAALPSATVPSATVPSATVPSADA